MSRGKFKMIMIAVLIFINVFLAADIIITEHMAISLPQGTVRSFEEILDKHGIEVDKTALPKKYETRTKLLCEFYDINTLTGFFMDGKVTYKSDGRTITAECGDKTMEIKGNGFSYRSNTENADKSGKEVMKALEKTGICLTGAFYDEAEEVVRVKFDSAVIEGIYLKAGVDENGEIAFAEGIWPKITTDGKDKKVSVISAMTDIVKEIPTGARIESIKKTYVFKTVEKSPVIADAWKIVADGKEYVVTK